MEAGWFCPVCGTAIGPYNAYLPNLQILSVGEVLRSGLNDHYRRTLIVVGGYVLLSWYFLSVFAPVYWFFLLRHIRAQNAQESMTSLET